MFPSFNPFGGMGPMGGPMGMGPFGMGMPGGIFQQQYRCYPVSFIDKPQLEKGDKIVMPPSALEQLARLHISYPMLFELTNTKRGRKTHSGVLEFIAEEGVVYLPYWMMQNLLVEEGSVITIKSATLPKGTFVKFQPQSSDFLDISNPKAVLETALRGFSALSKGDTIRIAYNNKSFNLDVLETKPRDAISLIETDLQVDFAPPLDYKEPERVYRSTSSAAAAPAPAPSSSSSAPALASSPPPPEDTSKFKAFGGGGYRLDGKAISSSPTPIGAASSSGSAAGRAAAKGASGSASSSPSTSSPAAAAAAAAAAHLRFGHSASPPVAAKAKKAESESEESEEEEDKPKFKAFGGQGYSLRG